MLLGREFSRNVRVQNVKQNHMGMKSKKLFYKNSCYAQMHDDVNTHSRKKKKNDSKSIWNGKKCEPNDRENG